MRCASTPLPTANVISMAIIAAMLSSRDLDRRDQIAAAGLHAALIVKNCLRLDIGRVNHLRSSLTLAGRRL